MRRIAPFLPACLMVAAAVLPTMGHAAPAPDYAVVATIPGADGGWDYASVDPVRGRLYVARAAAVMAVDLATGKVTDTFAPAQRAHAVLPIDNGATLVETDGTTGLTRFINADTGGTLAEVATGKKPDAAYFDSATGLIVVMNPGSSAVTLLDPKPHALVRMISVPGGLEAGEGDGKGHAFINLEEANALAEVDLAAGKLVRRIPLAGCDGPTGLAVVDAASGTLLQTLKVGEDPDAVIADPARGLAFVPSGHDGTLTAIAIDDPAKFAVVATIQTQVGARTGALDPRTGRIYLPTATMTPAEGGAHHGQAKPGTFVVLVVAPKG